MRGFANALAVMLLAALPRTSHALTPFDITNPTQRPVIVYIDNNYKNPASVGGNLVDEFTGTWSSSGSIGTVTVAAADAASAYQSSGAPGLPWRVSEWTPLKIVIDVPTGNINDMSMDGFGYTYFAQFGQMYANYMFVSIHLNTRKIDRRGVSYVSTLYQDSPGIFFNTPDGSDYPGEDEVDWCVSFNPQFCPAPYFQPGPSPLPYNAATGRFNAIGEVATFFCPNGQLLDPSSPPPTAASCPAIAPTDPQYKSLSSYQAYYGTMGDAQLFEVPVQPGPALTQSARAALALTLGVTSVLAGIITARRGGALRG